MHSHYYFALLLSLVWLGQGQNTCQQYPSEACPRLNPSLTGFPDNAEHLEEQCKGLKTVLECLNDYQENCNTFQLPPKRHFEVFLRARNKICEKDSIWFKGVLKHSHCYQNFVENLPRDFPRKCSEEIERRPNLAYLNDTDNHPDLIRCYYTVEVTSCVIAKLSQDCGKGAKELVLHIYKEAVPWNFFCAEDFQEAGMKLLNDLNFALDPETTEEEFAALIDVNE